MAEKTIAQVFGTGAARLTSGATTPSAGLFIPDSIFIAAGLTSPATATAEGHVAAIVVALSATLVEADYTADTINSIYVSSGFSTFVTRGTDSYRVDQKIFNLAKIDSGATLDPDNY
jgi:hypothetical protein